MTPSSLVERLDKLERTVEALAGLPARVAVVEVQISQLRDEMRVGFSAVRQDIAQTNARMLELREETTTSIAHMHAQMLELHEETTTSIAQTHTQMRVLHEDVVSRIATLKEAPRRPKKHR